MELTFDALSKNYGKKQALIGFSAELTGGIILILIGLKILLEHLGVINF